MTQTLVEESNATVTLATGFASFADTYTSGGNHAIASTSGKTVTITRTTASGFTGFVVRFTGRSDSTRNATITIDGGTPITVDQGGIHTNGSADGNYSIYRQLAGPYSFATNTAHTIVITSGTGVTSFDAIEYFTAETSTVDEVLGFGHSWMYSVINGSSATQNTQRVNLLVANYLRSTEVNHGIPAEDLTNGDYHAPSPFQGTKYYNQGTIYVPGWMRAESGASWPAPGPAMGASALLTTTQTGALGTQWWARKPRVALVMHGFNDVGYSTIYDQPGYGIPSGNRNASAAATSPGAALTAAQTATGIQAGYGIGAFKQRLRELQMRMQLNSPLTETYYFGVGPANVSETGVYTAAYSNNRYLWWQYSEAIRAVTQEPWVRNAYYVDILQAMTNRGGTLLFGTDNAHPNNAGNLVMFEEWRRVYEATHATVGIAAGRIA